MPGCDFPSRSRAASEASVCSYDEVSEDEFYDAFDDVSDDVCQDAVSEEEQSTSSSEAASKPTSPKQPKKNTENSEFVEPDEPYMKRIVARLVYYFADEHLAKDIFLRGRIERSSDRFLTIKFLSSLKKIRNLTKDYRIVQYSLQKMTPEILELNKDGTKVRRKIPFTSTAAEEVKEPSGSAKVLVTNIPRERCTVDSLAALFASFGEVLSVRLLEPGNDIPTDLKEFQKTYSALRTTRTCAVVEISKVSAARNAVAKLDGKKDDWRAMHMTLMRKPQSKKAEEQSAQNTDISRASPIKHRLGKDVIRISEHETDTDSAYSSRRASPVITVPEHFLRVHRKSYNSFSDDSDSVGSTPRSSPLGSPAISRRQINHSSKNAPSQATDSWFQRRLQQQPTAGHSFANISRQPRGPDGTKGFQPKAFILPEIIVS